MKTWPKSYAREIWVEGPAAKEFDWSLFLSVIQLSLVIILLLSVTGYLGRLHKLAELTSHFKAQYLLCSIACLLLFLFYREMVWAAIATLGAAINLAAIAPWYVGRKITTGDQASGRRLKLILVNVNFENTAHETFIDVVRRRVPDMLVVQEVDTVWRESLQALQNIYPFSEILPKGGGSGMAFYSRFPFDRLTIDFPEGDARPGILARMNIDGVSVSILSLHPRAPIEKGHFELRNGMLASAAVSLRNLPAPKICIGDLNITPWSPYYRSFVEQTGLMNVRKGFGLLPSWPTFLFFRWLMIPLDHCLVSEGISVAGVETGEHVGSDHLPLIVEFVLEVE